MALHANGVEGDHLRREESRVDTGAWSAKTIDRVLPELSSPRYEEHLDAENRSADQVAADIVSRHPNDEEAGRLSEGPLPR